MATKQIQVNQCYDSHVHLLGTGEWASQLQLWQVRNTQDLKNLQISFVHKRCGVVLGIGLDFTKWQDVRLTNKTLNDLFPNDAVYFSQADGHGGIGNDLALNWFAQKFPDLANELLAHEGRVIEGHHYRVLSAFSADELTIENLLLSAQTQFLDTGFTHVRDMTGSFSQWDAILKLAGNGKWMLAVESHIPLDPPPQNPDPSLHQKYFDDLNFILAQMSQYRGKSPLLRPVGIKIFYDGTLGSQTALISQAYLHPEKGVRGLRSETGLRQWQTDDYKKVLRSVWEAGFELSVHAIGDQAVHEVVCLTRETLSSRYQAPVTGRLNLEHVELCRPETINMMKGIHVTCHMQPSQLLTDEVWLTDRVGPEISAHAFRWESILTAGIPVFWGSDSPIAEPSIAKTWQGLSQRNKNLSKNKKYDALGLAIRGHSHPDLDFVFSQTEFEFDDVAGGFKKL